jgi:hypothetical protein
MAADDKPRSFLWSNGAGNAASALLLLVAGWILGQLKWDHMLMTGVGIAVVLVAFLTCRYVYALRHPVSGPLTLADLRAELKRARAAPVDLEGAAVAVTAPAAGRAAAETAVVIAQDSGEDVPADPGSDADLRWVRVDFEPLPREFRRRAKLPGLQLRLAQTSFSGPAAIPAPRRAAFRQMLGLR